MTTWTDSAKDKLDDYLTRLRATLHASGADPAEVTDDIRRHISEEATARKLEVVTTDDVDRMLQRLGAPEALPTRRFLAPEAPPQLETPRLEPKRLHGLLLFFGVVLPFLTLLIELATRMCAATLFDPMPDLWHVTLVAVVPVVNGLAWWAVRERKCAWRPWLGVANAFSLGIAFYYTLIFSTLVPFAFIGLIFFGLGLLPLSPMFSLIAAWRLRVLLKRSLPGAESATLPGLGWGLGAAALAVTLIALPVPLTRYWSRIAATEAPKERNEAIQRLRDFGHERTLLTDCYGNTGWGSEAPFGMHFQGRPVSAEEARSIYYRVTGDAFNSVPPPQHGFSSARWDFLDEFSWDTEQGGTIVGGRLTGLSLAQSRMDGLMDADAAWSYVEWTLEFKNMANVPREARAQIALPPGGVVSRLTLWVNGEEREAAFAGCGQVREAYQKVVNVQRRDPVLVTSSGPDRVLMQCFPVPSGGGTIKVRLGVTAPLHLESADSAMAVWPRFIERNFGVPEHLEHSLWVESRQPLEAANPRFKPDQSRPGSHGLRGQLRDAALSSPSSTVRLRRNAALNEAWVTDPRSPDQQIVRQVIKARAETPPDRIVLVLDGAKGMNEFFPQIAEAVRRLPEGVEFAVLMAGDEVEELSPMRRGDNALYRQVAQRIARSKGMGGQDNVPALALAWDMAAEKPRGVVVWIHGPQPQLLENGEAIQQRFDWRPGAGPVLYEMQTTPGPDRVLERLNGKAAIKSAPRFGTLQDDLGRLITSLQGKAVGLELVRERSASGLMPVALRGKESSKHLARLWAYDEILRLIAANKREAAVQIAGLYQLVTPVSGAVVLETRQQFEQAGLHPVDPQSVPTVPEPGSIVLLAVGLLASVALYFHRKRDRRSTLRDG